MSETESEQTTIINNGDEEQNGEIINKTPALYPRLNINIMSDEFLKIKFRIYYW
jgi:hypothetical protein